MWIHQDLAPQNHAENEKQEVPHQWGGGEEPCPQPLPSSHTHHASPHPHTQTFGCGARATPASHQPCPHDCAVWSWALPFVPPALHPILSTHRGGENQVLSDTGMVMGNFMTVFPYREGRTNHTQLIYILFLFPVLLPLLSSLSVL